MLITPLAVGFFVQLTALGSVHVFRPELFQMDERTLPGAEQIMLQSRYGDGIGWGMHGCPYRRRINVMPLGKPFSSTEIT